MKLLFRKIKFIYFLKSVIIPIHIEDRILIFKNFFKYLYICFLNKKKQNIIASYPSSGWNYFNTVIKSYMAEKKMPNNFLIFGGLNAKNIILNEKVSNFHTHLCYFEIPFFGFGNIKNNKKIIISRNYVTSIFSYYKKYKREISFEEFIYKGKNLKRMTDFYNSWSSNVDENENLYIVKYENLKNNPIKYFEEAIKFLNIDQNVDKQKLEKVLEEMSFEKIKVNKEDVFLGGDNYEKLIKKETLKYIKKYLEKHLNLKTKINFNYDII
jgi:hypothetical protein